MAKLKIELLGGTVIRMVATAGGTNQDPAPAKGTGVRAGLVQSLVQRKKKDNGGGELSGWGTRTRTLSGHLSNMAMAHAFWSEVFNLSQQCDFS